MRRPGSEDLIGVSRNFMQLRQGEGVKFKNKTNRKQEGFIISTRLTMLQKMSFTGRKVQFMMQAI